MSSSIFYNGEDISQYVHINYGIVRGLLPNINNQAVKVGQQNGSHFMSHSYDTRLIKIPVSVTGNNIQANLQQLARILNVTEPKPLIFSDLPDRYFLCTPSGDNSITELAEYGNGTLNFECFTPYAIGTKQMKATFDGSEDAIKFFYNFNNKITGDLNSNPNSAYVGEDISTNLDNPQFYKTEFSQQDYTALYHGLRPQDSTDVVNSYAYYQAGKGHTARMLFKFDLVKILNLTNSGLIVKYNLGTLSKQVDFLKKNIDYLEFRTWATGAGGSNFQYFNGSDFAGTKEMPQGIPDYWNYQINNQSEINTLIDDYGCCYILISAISDENSFVKCGYIDVRGGLSISGEDTSKTSKNNTISIEYTGTYPTPLNFHITNNESDNGYLGLIGASQIIQIGNPSTPETVDNKHSERLISDTFDNGASKWSINTANIFFEPSTSKLDGSWSNATLDQGMQGEACKNRIWPIFKQDPNVWNGTSISQNLPKDSSGVMGACNFVCQADIRFSGTTPSECGVEELIIDSSDGKHLAGISFRDESDSTAVDMVLYVGDDVIFANKYEGLSDFVGKLTIQKFGDSFYFKIDKIVNNQNYWLWDYHWNDSNYEKTEAGSVSFCDLVYGDHKNLDLGIFDITFDKYNVDDWEKNPNCFNAEDVIDVKCDDYKVLTYVNNALSIWNQDVGSQPIMLQPGSNVIKVVYSTFSNRPNVEVSYTPRYI